MCCSFCPSCSVSLRTRTGCAIPPPHAGRRTHFQPAQPATRRTFPVTALDLVLRWFLDDVRGKFPDSPALFADESGGHLHQGTVRNRLRYLMELEGPPAADRFSPHALRRACATHNYERGVDLGPSSKCWVTGPSVRP
ncbi:tyrosine-type recombinase/integrase [Streptomyces roseus]|uniref:tyrosine-type recombinase/integrase n=1 Tax=Streptomyces roseus TaxID=66430 RepID=UPI0033FD262B